MRYWLIFVLIVSGLPLSANAQWLSTYEEDPFGTEHITAAFSARDGKALGVRCIGGKRLEFLFLPNEQGDEAIATTANLQGAKLLLRIDDDPPLSLKARILSSKGKILSFTQTDRQMALRIAAARRRVAAALLIAGNKFGTVSLGVRGSRRHIQKALKACQGMETTTTDGRKIMKFKYSGYDLSQGGYALEASSQCKDTKLLVAFADQELKNEEFERGRRNFKKAIYFRDLKWACGAALRLYDGTKGLGLAILVKR